jgi:predicted DNA-binding transcriptional regulator YafY
VSKKSSFYRVFEILKLLNDSKRLCLDELSRKYGVSQRTIRRDFELILEIFGDFLTKEKGCYRAYKKLFLEDVLNSSELTMLSNIINVFGKVSNENLLKDETKDLLKKSSIVYDFKSRPFETIENQTILKKLEYSIKFQKVIELKYSANSSFVINRFEPYKIIFVNENFYLVGINRDKNRFEFLRVSMIEKLKESSQTFFLNHDIVSFIKKIQSPWSDFTKDEITVTLKANKSIARYFLKKNYLPSQKVVQKLENGDIIVEYKITNVREIEELIIKWLPRLKIISPNRLKKYIKKSLDAKINAIEPSDKL